MRRNLPRQSSKGTLHSGDDLWNNAKNRLAQSADFDHKKNVILIHGFTAHGRYLERLAETLEAHGYNIFILNYNSYRGIERAATVLAEKLQDLNELGDGIITQNKVALVCHSMGGLVGRAFFQLTPCTNFVSTLVTLGTPHLGTLHNSKLVHYIVKWGEYITEKIPGYRPGAQSAKELTGKDGENGKVSLLEKLDKNTETLQDIPIMSVSAGKPWLEIGENPFFNDIANWRLQKDFGGKQNDGLVLESSSDLSLVLKARPQYQIEHIKDYAEYYDINHTNLIFNQNIALKIVRWLKENH